MSAPEAASGAIVATAGSKRPAEEEAEVHLAHTRPRIGFGGHPHRDPKFQESAKSGKPVKCAKDAMNEKYVEFVGGMMYPKSTTGPFGFQLDKGRLPTERINTLGYLLCPLRTASVMERWSPYEISLFEASITLHGKSFHTIQKYVQTKSVKEIIEFYYEWKKTSHYLLWKKTYVLDERDYI